MVRDVGAADVMVHEIEDRAIRSVNRHEGSLDPTVSFYSSSRTSADSQNTQRILAAFDARKWIWQRDHPKSEKNNPRWPQKWLVCLVGDGR